MRKLFICGILGFFVILGSCTSSTTKTESVSEEDFSKTQPFSSGEYAASSYRVDTVNAQLHHFDGRILVALSPESSGMYIFENGNHTNFKKRIVLSAPFEKKDSVYVTTDNKNKEIIVIQGAETDTLVFFKGDTRIKVAFDKKPIRSESANAAWQRISTALSK